jgi:ribosomal protein S18 acetylase RimI-like enzyme
MSVSIRLVAAGEERLLSLVDEDVFDGPVSARQLAAFVADPRHMLVIAVDAGRVVGMATGVQILQPDKAPQLFINEVGVAPAYRRRGIARGLAAMLFSVAKDRGCASAWVATEPGNAAANALYRSIPNGAERAEVVLYEWPLDP